MTTEAVPLPFGTTSVVEFSLRALGEAARAAALPGSVDATDQELAAHSATRPGETGEAQFLDFHSATAQRVSAYVLQATGNPHVTEDLVQESFLRLLRAGVNLGDRASARAYLFRIATNLIRDRYRRRDLEFPVEQEDSTLPDRDAAPQERRALRREVRRLLRELSLRDQQLLWLAHVEQLSHREVGAALGLREISIRPMLFRARRRFAAVLRRAGLDGPRLVASGAAEGDR